MKVLYVVNAVQKSFERFSDHPRTNFPWVDALLGEIDQMESISYALAVPVSESDFRRHINGSVTLYGLPYNPPKPSKFLLLRKRTTGFEEARVLDYLRMAIDDFKPDIIQVFGTENQFGLVSSIVDIPVVIHFQGSVIAVSEKWFSGINRSEQKKSLTFRKILYRSGVYNEYPVFRKKGERELLIMKSSKFFIGRTEFDKKVIALMSPDSVYFHCEEFIRKEFFENRWNASLTKNIKCISILKGVTYKGIDLLFEASKTLTSYGFPDIEFIVCGVKENEEVVRILHKRYKDDDCLRKVSFIGKVGTEELIKELLSSNFYVHPSYMENSSNSICEAMALGMPVIATNSGGTGSLIDDGIDGLLVQEGEALSLAASLSGLIRNYTLAKTIGDNARERAFNRHNPEMIRNKTLEIYRAILGKSKVAG